MLYSSSILTTSGGTAGVNAEVPQSSLRLAHLAPSDSSTDGLLLLPENKWERQPYHNINDSDVSQDSLRHLRAGSYATRSDLRPENVRFLWDFPFSLERFFQRFDDRIVRAFQAKWTHNFVITGLSVLVTALTAIETGVAAPFVLFALGRDGLATEVCYLSLVTAVFSQIPKRFIWRYRPYMVRRAIKMREKEPAVTSSVPSRAVTCATVYSFIICYAVFYEVEKQRFEWWMPLIVLLSVLLSSFSRIHLGVHYPSDCLLGLFQGLVIVVLGTLLRHADAGGCDSCYQDGCYSFSPPQIIDSDHLSRINLVVLGAVAGAMLVTTIISVIKPFEFWSKCDRVFGMIMPVIAFQLTFLCPLAAGSAFRPPLRLESLSAGGIILSVLICGTFVLLMTGLAWLNNGRFPVLVFCVLFTIMYTSLAAWRLFVWHEDSAFAEKFRA